MVYEILISGEPLCLDSRVEVRAYLHDHCFSEGLLELGVDKKLLCILWGSLVVSYFPQSILYQPVLSKIAYLDLSL